MNLSGGFGRTHIRPAAAALAVALASVLGTAPAFAKGKGKGRPRKPTPDLTVESVSANGLGFPQRMVIDPSGALTGRITVRVVVKNVGKVAAPPSRAEIVLGILKIVYPLGEAKFKEIKPGKQRSDVVTLDRSAGIEEVGLGVLSVFANQNEHGEEGFKENNHRNDEGHLKKEIAVIPYEWKVPSFETTGRTPSGYTAVTKADPGAFSFRFREWNKTLSDWEWNAEGAIKAQTTGELFGCTVSGTGEATHSPWEPVSKGRQGLMINQDLTNYDAFIYGSVEKKYPLHFTGCPPGITIPGAPENDIQDLLTARSGGSDVDPWEPGENELHGSGENATKVFTSWKFAANIPAGG